MKFCGVWNCGMIWVCDARCMIWSWFIFIQRNSWWGMIEVPQRERQLNPNFEQIIGESESVKRRGTPFVVKFCCCVWIRAQCLVHHNYGWSDWFCCYLELHYAVPIINFMSQDYRIYMRLFPMNPNQSFCQISESSNIYIRINLSHINHLAHSS